MAREESRPKGTFSIALCTRDGAAYLPEQLGSFLTQTRPPDELVVCDDASGDATAEIITGFSVRAPFPVRSYRNAKPLGATPNFAQAIGLCRGDIIALSDQDDVWKPEKLQRLEEAFLSRPRAAAACSDAEIVDERLSPLGFGLWGRMGLTPRLRSAAEDGRFFDVLLAENLVTGATLAFRSSYRELILPMPEGCVHDAWIALLISAVAPWVLIPEPLIRYRQHGDNQIGVPPKVFSRARWGRAQKNPVASYAQEARHLLLARERLACLAPPQARADAVALLDAKIAHLETRSRLPHAAWRRWPIVLRELAAGRYHRCSTGWRSAAKDLWRGCPKP